MFVVILSVDLMISISTFLVVSFRFLETSLESVMATVPINYIKKEAGVYVITSELHYLKELYTFLDTI